MTKVPIYGVVAEFDNPTQLVAAAREVRNRGYRKFEAYTPYPIGELDEIVPGFNPLAAICFIGGAIGAATAWIMQYYIAAIDYPINVGGRPLYSWPAFIPILFELTVLFAACAAFFGALALCGLPKPHFPLFSLPRFAAASKDHFFLCIEDAEVAAAEVLRRFDPVEVWEVEDE